MNEKQGELKFSYTEKNPLLVYKFVRADGRAPWGHGTWSLPTKSGEPGSARGIGDYEPVPCMIGIHGFQSAIDLLVSQLSSDRLFVAALWGKVVKDINKVAAQNGRLLFEVQWDNRTWMELSNLHKGRNWFGSTQLEKGIAVNKILMSRPTASARAYERWRLKQEAKK